MKLYVLLVSNTSRPIRALISENKLPIEEVALDFAKGEHASEPYISLNPNGLVPTLVDDDFVLTESSAIMKYLADKFSLGLYPKDLKTRAKVNELMDWFNTGFYRDYAYNVVYPQIYPHHRRQNEEAQARTIEWGKTQTRKWLTVLNEHWLGEERRYLVGDQLTIADIFGYALITCGIVTRDRFNGYPNIERWMKEVGTLGSWPKVNEALVGFRDYVKDQQFVNVA
ncbi:MAG TPA: glutathione S-transferase family protein [Bauldia sp.]|nr:glutathione S-transferase family protein [Bauldia sp.]